VIGVCSLACTACQYGVPITSDTTRKVQERLLGDWTSSDGKEKLKLRSLDDSVYIVYYDGDLFRAYHSDVAETFRDPSGAQLERSQICLCRLEIVGRWQELEIAECQRQARPKGNQGLSHCGWAPDKKRQQS